MAKFKIGDRVKYAPSVAVSQASKVYFGKVEELYGSKPDQEYVILWDDYPDHTQRGYFDSTLVLEGSIPTDAELAELARTARVHYYESVKALIDRGYVVQIEGNQNTAWKFTNLDKALFIKKVITEEVIL